MDTLITEYLYCMCGGIVFAAFCFNGDKFSSILQYKFTHFSEKMEHENHIFLKNSDLKTTFFLISILCRKGKGFLNAFFIVN